MAFLRRFYLTRHQTPLIYQTIQFRQILGGGEMNNCRLKRWVELHIIQNGLNGFLRGDWFRKNRIKIICSSNEYWFKKFPRLLSQSRQLSKESFGPKGNSGLVCQQPPLLLFQDFLHLTRELSHIASFLWNSFWTQLFECFQRIFSLCLVLASSSATRGKKFATKLSFVCCLEICDPHQFSFENILPLTLKNQIRMMGFSWSL